MVHNVADAPLRLVGDLLQALARFRGCARRIVARSLHVLGNAVERELRLFLRHASGG